MTSEDDSSMRWRSVRQSLGRVTGEVPMSCALQAARLCVMFR